MSNDDQETPPDKNNQLIDIRVMPPEGGDRASGDEHPGVPAGGGHPGVQPDSIEINLKFGPAGGGEPGVKADTAETSEDASSQIEEISEELQSLRNSVEEISEELQSLRDSVVETD